MKLATLLPMIVNAPGRCFGDTSPTLKVYAFQPHVQERRKEMVASTLLVCQETDDRWCSVLPVLHFRAQPPLGLLDKHDDILGL